MDYNEISFEIIGSSIEVHKNLGPGLLENIYEECLCFELNEKGIKTQRQVILPVNYKSKILDLGYRADIMVDDQVIIELKSIEDFHPIHEAQILTYLKLSKCKLGLLMNFNVTKMRNGIRRFIM